MKILHYLRFKAADSSKKRYHLVANYSNPQGSQLLNFNDSLKLIQERDSIDETFSVLSDDNDIAYICFPGFKYCYGSLFGAQDLILGTRKMKGKYIDLLIIYDMQAYSHIFYQALKNGQFREETSEIRKKLKSHDINRISNN